ncbi:MAG: T9SS type A sorting domain-containing protein [Bacteroidota bacterium]
MSQQIDTTFWDVSSNAGGGVNTIVKSGNTLYVGGTFHFAGPVTGNGVTINLQNAERPSEFPKVNNTVKTSIADGYGGWYIGGDFTKIGRTNVNRVAHLKPDLTLDVSFVCKVNKSVNALLLHRGALYIGGTFDSINGIQLASIAKVNAQTGSLIGNWNTAASIAGIQSTIVRAMAVSDTTLYIAGSFSSIGNKNRKNVAALSTNTGFATTWNPGVKYNILCFAIKDSTLYAGGDFTEIGNINRTCLAAISTISGRVRPWGPKVWRNNNCCVNTITIDGNLLFIGGLFTNVGLLAKFNLASISLSTGQPTNWRPGFDSAVYALAVSGNTVFTGGKFIAEGNRSHFAAINKNSGLLEPLLAHADDNIRCIALSGNKLYLGGNFKSIGGEPRNNAAAFDIATGELTNWKPNPRYSVFNMAVTDSLVYILGYNLISVKKTTGETTAWNPQFNDSPGNLLISGQRLYVIGQFTQSGNETRNHAAAFDINSGLLTEWNPNADDVIYDITSNGSSIFLAGPFQRLNNTYRNRLGAVDKTTGVLKPWVPVLPPAVPYINKIIMAGSNVFTSFSNSSTNCFLNAFDSAGAGDTPMPCISSYIYSAAIHKNIIYLVGGFSMIGNAMRKYAGAIDLNTNLVTGWSPDLSGNLITVCASGGKVFIGGKFNESGNVLRLGVAALDSSDYILSSIMQEEKSTSAFTLYPNPASTELRISNLPTNTTVQIFNLLGQVALSYTYNGNSLEINTLQPGLYCVAVTGRGRKYFVKE